MTDDFGQSDVEGAPTVLNVPSGAERTVNRSGGIDNKRRLGISLGLLAYGSICLAAGVGANMIFADKGLVEAGQSCDATQAALIATSDFWRNSSDNWGARALTDEAVLTEVAGGTPYIVTQNVEVLVEVPVFQTVIVTPEGLMLCPEDTDTKTPRPRTATSTSSSTSTATASETQRSTNTPQPPNTDTPMPPPSDTPEPPPSDTPVVEQSDTPVVVTSTEDIPPTKPATQTNP